MPLGKCIVAEARYNWYLHDINIYSLSKNEDFTTFNSIIGLTKFANDPCKTYKGLRRELLSSFNIDFTKNKDTYNVHFTMFAKSWSMTLHNVCSILHIPYGRNEDIMRNSLNDSLEEFWKSIAVDDRQTVGRGKLNCI
jgi:hypothetical protein